VQPCHIASASSEHCLPPDSHACAEKWFNIFF
jgi:hypothetical protein